MRMLVVLLTLTLMGLVSCGRHHSREGRHPNKQLNFFHETVKDHFRKDDSLCEWDEPVVEGEPDTITKMRVCHHWQGCTVGGTVGEGDLATPARFCDKLEICKGPGFTINNCPEEQCNYEVYRNDTIKYTFCSELTAPPTFQCESDEDCSSNENVTCHGFGCSCSIVVRIAGEQYKTCGTKLTHGMYKKYQSSMVWMTPLDDEDEAGEYTGGDYDGSYGDYGYSQPHAWRHITTLMHSKDPSTGYHQHQQHEVFHNTWWDNVLAHHRKRMQDMGFRSSRRPSMPGARYDSPQMPAPRHGFQYPPSYPQGHQKGHHGELTRDHRLQRAEEAGQQRKLATEQRRQRIQDDLERKKFATEPREPEIGWKEPRQSDDVDQTRGWAKQEEGRLESGLEGEIVRRERGPNRDDVRQQPRVDMMSSRVPMRMRRRHTRGRREY